MDTKLILCMLMVVLGVHSNKKGNRPRKAYLEWDATSMPALNKRYVSFNDGKGKDLDLDCRVHAHPKASVTWLKDGVQIQSSDSIEIKKFNLILRALSSETSGNYTCVVNNKHGRIEWTFHVDVPVKIWPLEIEGPHNITQPVGSSVTFTCKVLNDPQATVRWQRVRTVKNIDESAPQAAFLPESAIPHELTLENIQQEDEGEYRCMAGNVWGLKYSSAWLTLQEHFSTAELPDVSGMERNKVMDNNVNSNDDKESNPTKRHDIDVNPSQGDHQIHDDDNEPESNDSHEAAGPYVTTKRPKKKNNKHNKGGKKTKKDKGKNRTEDTTPVSHTDTTWRTDPIAAIEEVHTTTYYEIWEFETKKENHGPDDARYKTVENNNMAETANADSADSTEDEQLKGSISSWTIYTIVGAIAGVVLLLGLVAITLTVCWKRDEIGMFKSSNV